MKKIDWPTALVVVVGLAVFAFLVWMDADTGFIVTVVAGVLGIGAAQQLGAIKTQTNGTASALMEELRESRRENAALMREILAARQPAAPTDDRETVSTR